MLSSKNEHITVILADDHPIVLKGLYDYLGGRGFNIEATTSNGYLAIDIINSHKPIVAILDIDMPEYNGIQVAQQVSDSSPDTRIILLSSHNDPEYILEAKASNILGYVLKEDALLELERAIRTVVRGERYFSTKLLETDTSQYDQNLQFVQSLTPSELKILRYLARNHKTIEIADMLDISKRTVDTHRANIIAKLSLYVDHKNLTVWVTKYQNLIEKNGGRH